VQQALGQRLEIHNASVDKSAADSHLCGMLHLASGRVCLLPERHRGPCEFAEPNLMATPFGQPLG